VAAVGVRAAGAVDAAVRRRWGARRAEAFALIAGRLAVWW